MKFCTYSRNGAPSSTATIWTTIESTIIDPNSLAIDVYSKVNNIFFYLFGYMLIDLSQLTSVFEATRLLSRTMARLPTIMRGRDAERHSKGSLRRSFPVNLNKEATVSTVDSRPGHIVH